jgi:beta-aspartyl-peptidase (threonine type)
MNRFRFALSLLSITLTLQPMAQEFQPVIVIHGGAGTILKENMTPELEKAYQQKLEEALNAGYKVLQDGGTSTEAVTAAITIMEDSPLFNAGKGAVFTHDERNEMDASIMEGKERRAGAVAGVQTIRNPILAAKAVMQQSEHVLLTGKGAEEFAGHCGLALVDPSYFRDETRLKQLRKLKEQQKVALDHDSTDGGSLRPDSSAIEFNINLKSPDQKFGTVGCVALDKAGNLAAGTSTGGMTNKRYGRVGDSPIIGAGTFADNNTCAVSCTGHGEFFIRYMAAGDVSARMQYAHQPLDSAATGVITDLLKVNGLGGLIALDRQGNISMPFNTAGMYRGYINGRGERKTFIYKN